MKQRRVGEYAVEMAIRQIELEEILLPYFPAAVGARHYGQARGAFQTYGDVTEFGERLEVASRPAAKIEDRERRVTLNGSQQRFDVLTDVVSARALPEIIGTPVVVFQREAGDFFQVLRSQYDGLLEGILPVGPPLQPRRVRKRATAFRRQALPSPDTRGEYRSAAGHGRCAAPFPPPRGSPPGQRGTRGSSPRREAAQ